MLLNNCSQASPQASQLPNWTIQDEGNCNIREQEREYFKW